MTANFCTKPFYRLFYRRLAYFPSNYSNFLNYATSSRSSAAENENDEVFDKLIDDVTNGENRPKRQKNFATKEKKNFQSPGRLFDTLSSLVDKEHEVRKANMESARAKFGDEQMIKTSRENRSKFFDEKFIKASKEEAEDQTEAVVGLNTAVVQQMFENCGGENVKIPAEKWTSIREKVFDHEKVFNRAAVDRVTDTIFLGFCYAKKYLALGESYYEFLKLTNRHNAGTLRQSILLFSDLNLFPNLPENLLLDALVSLDKLISLEHFKAPILLYKLKNKSLVRMHLVFKLILCLIIS